MEMGFVPGETVFVQRYAPLRDPVEFVVKQYHVSLRRADAALVEVVFLPVDKEAAASGEKLRATGWRHGWPRG